LISQIGTRALERSEGNVGLTVLAANLVRNRRSILDIEDIFAQTINGGARPNPKGMIFF